MKLYYDDVLSPRKVCALALYLKSPVEYVRVDLGRGEHKSPAYLAINPNAKVPSLTDGDLALWEANAILMHLAGKAGTGLWPTEPRDQVEIVRWFSWDTDHFGRAAGTLYFEHIVKRRFADMGPDPDAVADATKNFCTCARVLEDHLTGRDWLVGDRLTIADFAVANALPYVEEARIPLGDFRNIASWHDRLCAIEAWRSPWPARKAEAA